VYIVLLGLGYARTAFMKKKMAMEMLDHPVATNTNVDNKMVDDLPSIAGDMSCRQSQGQRRRLSGSKS
jgi:hypothetical protein